MKHPSDARGLVLARATAHCIHMRSLLLLLLLGVDSGDRTAFGTWKLNATRSTFSGDTQPRILTMRIEPHVRGEVFTLDRVEADGRATSSSTILYLDGADRDFRDGACSGTQSSRRVDGQTVEILRKCASGSWTRLVRRRPTQAKELVLEITEQHPDGRSYKRRLVLEKQ